MIRIVSAREPFTAPRLAHEAVVALVRADAMGLLPEGDRIETLDLPTFRKVMGRIRQAGIGTTLAFRFGDDVTAKPAILEHLLVQLNQALEESPAPHHEWRRLVEVLGADLLGRLLGISPSSVRRYQGAARATPDAVAARLHCLALIVGDLRGAYNDLGIRQWFHRKRAQLGGRAPEGLLTGGWDPTAPGPTQVRDLARALSAAPAT